MNEFEQKPKENENDATTSKILQQIHGSYQRFLPEYHAQKQALSTMPTSLGHVLCSSGRGLWNDRLQDWSLVELSAKSSERMMESSTMPYIEQENKPWGYGCGPLTHQPGWQFMGIGTIKPGEWYGCVSRGYVSFADVCNGVMACCNWNNADDGDTKPGNVPRYDIKGQPVVNKTSMEYIILSRKNRENVEGSTQSGFGWRGDAGSFLINRHAEVCGLYYGNATSWAGPRVIGAWEPNAGLVMSMMDLKKSIEARLGGEVSLCLSEDDLNLIMRELDN